MKHFFVIKAGKDYEDANSALIETNKILWKMSLCLMLIIFILVIGYLRLQSAVSVTVELPPKIFLSKDKSTLLYIYQDSPSFLQFSSIIPSLLLSSK